VLEKADARTVQRTQQLMASRLNLAGPELESLLSLHRLMD